MGMGGGPFRKAVGARPTSGGSRLRAGGTSESVEVAMGILVP